MVAQKVVRMGAVSVAVMASAVAVTAAVADAAAAKAAALKDALKDALKVVTKVVAASAASVVLKRVPKVHARSVRTALLARCVAKRPVTTARQTHKPVVMDSNAAKPALKTASRVLKVRAVSAPAANVVTAQNVVTAFRAMPWSKTLHWQTRPPWRQPCVAMALNKCKIVPPRTLAAMKAAVNVVTAMVAATIAGVNALKATTRVRQEMARSTLKRLRHLQWQRQRPCLTQTATPLP